MRFSSKANVDSVRRQKLAYLHRHLVRHLQNDETRSYAF